MNPLVIIVIGILLIAIFIIALITSSAGSKSTPEWKKKVQNQIYNIEKALQLNNYLSLKNSLIEADKLLDFVLKQKKVNGETLGERLKNSQNLYSRDDYNNIWTAHKLRNELVHEIDSKISDNHIKNQTNNLLKSIKKLIA
jgi:hypothetical protein